MDPHERAFAFIRERDRSKGAVPDDLVVSDSEPEREQRQAQQDRKTLHKPLSQYHGRPETRDTMRKPIIEGPIIEISDDSSSQSGCTSVIILSGGLHRCTA
jgi:hypothetical protein